PAVVGAAAVEVRDGDVVIGDRRFVPGDVITIDGGTGEVFAGAVVGPTEVVPAARTLLEWATALGVAIGAAGPATSNAEPARPPAPTGTVTPDACIRAIAIKGFAQPQGVADVVLSTPAEVQPVLDALVADGLVAPSAGAFRLTEAGTARAAALLSDEQAAWGVEAAVAALDGFLALDRRMKETVTAWQLRDPAVQLINDHADADYDAAVLDRLATLHADTAAWLTPLETGNPRLVGYGVRLGRAAEQAQAGDVRYVASPRVDSYHGIWFELHEDLIQLAGRSRVDEVAAGRA
ncbi:MAG: pyruvate, orthophosphate dikinase, partial [Chloroflexota bacterium]|nr:pyruvate, orthophosphate dikinase [Chloroflexota bacterium]